MVKLTLMRHVLPLVAVFAMASSLCGQQPPSATTSGAAVDGATAGGVPLTEPLPSLIYKVDGPSGRLDMTINTSRILTMTQKIAQLHINNPNILSYTALSPNQVQISAKATGVTQVNLWGEDQQVRTVDVIIYGDVKELEMVLQATFPNATLKIVPVANAVLISGFVDRPEHIDRIVRIAEQYFPKVINNLTLGGVQQVLLHVKIFEVSRTKLRTLGMDFAKITGSNVIGSAPSGLLTNTLDTASSTVPSVATAGANTFLVGIVKPNSSFFGVLNALRQDNMAKILAEPTLVTISGRPAHFMAGGSFYIVPQGLAASQPIQVNYGTQLDFVPIVLGGARVRLDVRPRVSQIDPSLEVQGYPGLLERNADTGLELQSGQTMALAGLVQSRVESQNMGLPWISEVPYLGVAFRSVKEKINEVELLILVTPELVDAMDANEVPPCGPGTRTTSPSDWELFMKGHLEVPKCCPNNCGNGGCQQNGGAAQGHENDACDEPPPDGMILSPRESIPTPAPSESTSNAKPETGASTGASTVASTVGSAGGKPFNSRNRYNSPKPKDASGSSNADFRDNPPGLIGPVGIDVVK